MQFRYGCRNLLGMGTRTRALGVESYNRGGVGSGQSPVRCSRMLLSRGAFRYTFILRLVVYPIYSAIIITTTTTKHTLPFTPLLSRCHSQQRGGEQGDGALVLITQGAEGPGHFQRNGLSIVNIIQLLLAQPGRPLAANPPRASFVPCRQPSPPPLATVPSGFLPASRAGGAPTADSSCSRRRMCI